MGGRGGGGGRGGKGAYGELCIPLKKSWLRPCKMNRHPLEADYFKIP